MKCQICKATITPIKTNNIEILQCEECRGFWIRKGDLNRIIKHRAGDLEFSSIDHHMHYDTHGIMKCAFCSDQAMIKVNFIEYSEIILDYCEACGAFWIDNGEADKMEEYIKKIEQNDSKPTILEIIMNTIFSLPKI